MLSLRDLSIAYPDQLWLELPDELQEKAWQRSQHHSNATIRCNAYLNDLCLNTFFPWLEDWFKEGQLAEEENNQPLIPIRIFQEESLPSLWEAINGIAIDVGETRLVLIPSATSNSEEFCIPQEWVDIPGWRADYYLVVQVNLGDSDEAWIRLGGYINYQKLKKKGVYEISDRAYYIDQHYLSEDLTLLLLDPQPILAENIREERVPSLSAEVAGRLLEKLGSSSVYCPRLTIEFEQWSALLTNEAWRQELYERRLGTFVTATRHRQRSINLGMWLHDFFETGWQSLEGFLKTDSEHLAFNFRQRRPSATEARKVIVEGIKLIDLGIELENQSVALLVGVAPEAEQRVGIRVQLYPAGGQTYLPSNIRLALLSPSGTILQDYKARIQDNLLQLKRFSCAIGKGFSIQVSLNDFSITEDFNIELLTEPEL